MPGMLGWTSAGAYAKERAEADAPMQPLYDKYLAMDVKAVAADPQAHAMGERLFLNNCAQCHGSDAGGGKGFPNLRDNDWLYGGDAGDDQDDHHRRPQGRDAAVRRGARRRGRAATSRTTCARCPGLPHDGLRAQLGKPIFAQNCAACHGADGKGNQAIGAPNLTDKIWLYGSSEATITETISKGRGARRRRSRAMPAHKDLLGRGQDPSAGGLRLGLVEPETPQRSARLAPRGTASGADLTQAACRERPSIRTPLVARCRPRAPRRSRSTRSARRSIRARSHGWFAELALGAGVR